MTQKRTHVSLSEKLLIDIDELLGRGKRSAFLTEVAEREVRRRRLLRMLSDETPIIDSEAHPEWKGGSSAWVRELRGHSDQKREEKLGDQSSPHE